GPGGFRRADSLSRAVDSTRAAPPPISVAALLDSATLALPDTSEFAFQPYRRRYSPDFVAQPSIGFVRDNFGNGVYGSTAIALSDVLGNSQMTFALAINGRINEGYVQASYADFTRRVNWAAGVSQVPYFFALPSTVVQDEPAEGLNQFRSNTRRLVYRQAQLTAWYPFNRFKRVEVGLTGGIVDDDIVSYVETYSQSTGFLVTEPEVETTFSNTIGIGQPNIALVHDNTIFGYTGPFLGTRYRLSLGTTIGGWQYSQFLADYRRYTRIVGPVTFSTRLLYYGRVGRDADQFSVFIGIPDIVRGHTSGSYRRDECGGVIDVNTSSGCLELERLIGEQVAAGNFELRFPLLTPQMSFVPAGFPPIEGTVFYDIGMAWNQSSTIRWELEPGDRRNPNVRAPIQAWGVGARVNLFGLMLFRVDWAFPLRRPGTSSLVTLSLGPTF
ncbi:MAG TPA: hypothetical protein VFX50_00415, partial [Gemmatimonadales bacterium]|nr:hypothetical protein [Gemmatimonadales bacterium]